jgi:hypothetical protein
MPIHLGDRAVSKVFVGSRRVDRVMLGGQRIWSGTDLYDDFNRPDEPLDAGTWHNEGPALDYKAAVVGNRMRLGIPDGLVGLVQRTSQMTYTGAHATTESGYLETLVASTGDSIPTLFGSLNFVTQVFGRMPVTGFEDGVGIDLRASQVGLVVRRDFFNDRVRVFGAFGAGDLIRLRWVVASGQPTTYTMFRNGQQLGDPWVDSTNRVVGGSGHRSLGVRVDGSKDLLGPRRFSPALDWVEYGGSL